MLLDLYKTDLTNDDPQIIEYMKAHTMQEILSNQSIWGEDLSPLIEVIENANS